MCKVDKKFRQNLYENEDPIGAHKTYQGLMKNYLLVHTQGTIGVFKHKRKNQKIIVWNIIKPFEKGHSHFQTLQVAKIIADNLSLNRKPKSNMCIRNLISFLRLATEDYRWLIWVEQLIETKKDKKLRNNSYYNVNKKVV